MIIGLAMFKRPKPTSVKVIIYPTHVFVIEEYVREDKPDSRVQIIAKYAYGSITLFKDPSGKTRVEISEKILEPALVKIEADEVEIRI